MGTGGYAALLRYLFMLLGAFNPPNVYRLFYEVRHQARLCSSPIIMPSRVVCVNV